MKTFCQLFEAASEAKADAKSGLSGGQETMTVLRTMSAKARLHMPDGTIHAAHAEMVLMEIGGIKRWTGTLHNLPGPAMFEAAFSNQPTHLDLPSMTINIVIRRTQGLVAHFESTGEPR